MSPLRYRARWDEPQATDRDGPGQPRDQTLQLANTRWHFASGETLITEHSVKYSPQAAAELAAQAGWSIRQRWHDSDDNLSLHCLEPSD